MAFAKKQVWWFSHVLCHLLKQTELQFKQTDCGE